MHRFLVGLVLHLAFLRGAVGLSQLARHLVRRVFHEDGRVAVRLGHLGLALGEAVEHVVRQDDRLQLDPGRVAVLAREHVHLALVDSKLANVGLQEEDVGALHQRIEDLCRSQRPFSAAHDLAALCDARNGKAARDVERERPVVLSMLRDLLGRPEELHALHVHPCSCPHMNQVVTDSLDALQVASHFVVHQSKPVSNPENECAARLCTLIHVHCLENTLSNVHSP
mmetsp:Transcript_16930/g.36299  ORF Transcript_16930/g.36299 Transcript_16930/m.36299 type:complete len:226 (+) Transcript_16930:1627-2304(+)